MTNKWFRKVNGSKIGDTPNDILHVNDTLIAITVNWSNIIQYIHPDGTACGATENVPNNRRMCSDGRYLYVTSYAHKCGSQTFTRGYVAKIDLKTKDVLKQALQDFDGTLIVVSHDRDFLDGLVSKVYEFGHGRVREHLCGIYEFLETKKMESLQELEKK